MPLAGPLPPMSTPVSRPRRVFRVVLSCAALAAIVVVSRRPIRFDLGVFRAEFHTISVLPILFATALIVGTNAIRSIRWSVFLRPVQRVPPLSLMGTQMLGFTAVAFFGRLADLTRPYLVSRRTGLPFASQVAVYTIERIFDLAAVAILFSVMLSTTPRGAPHRALLVRAGLVSLGATATLVLFALAIRHFGARGGKMAGRAVSRLSETFGQRIEEKMHAFRGGLDTFASVRDLGWALALSLGMWVMIAESYVQTTHAFPQTPALATLTFAGILPLMAASMGGSLLQLPVLGWFTQIALTAASMHTLYGAPIEASTACATMLLMVGTLSVVPFGLVYTRIERISLRAAAHPSA